MVPDADAVISIARDQGMLAALAPGAIWVQMSTIGLGGINDVMAMVDHERPDVVLLDAPVSGSKDPAEQGQLIDLRVRARGRTIHGSPRSSMHSATEPSGSAQPEPVPA